MKAFKILVVITALVVIVGLTSDAWAGCNPSRLFRSQGKPNNSANNFWDTTGSENAGNQIGRIWDSDDAGNSNSGLVGPNFGAQCPPANFWLDQGDGIRRKIDAFHGSTECNPAGCPTDNMTVVIEDYDAGGPPGIDGSAYYMAAMVLETPASDRWWDYGLVNAGGTAGNLTIPMLEFPEVVITGSNRAGASILVNYNNLDQQNSVHTWDVSTGAQFPVNRVISEWQLVKASGTSDPGRLRSNGWVTIQSTPYVDGGTPASFAVPCSNEVNDEYLAIGIGFNGGAAGIVDSALVGRAIPLECDPFLAQPDLPVEVDRKPSATQLEGKGGRSGGRR